MGINICHYPQEDRLDLTVDENLDLSLTHEIMDACTLVDERLMTCVIDCTRVVRVFDSGIALLTLLVRKLAQFGVRLVVIGDIPGLRLDALRNVTLAHGR
jgi:anti-anti-sigma regulatory factor